MHRQLIIGLDPGTTTAYAILDMQGKVISLKSSKQLKLDRVIRETAEKGMPLIVGTDRSKCPGMVSRFAAKTGATKAVPEHDISGTEKKALTKGREAQNSHQKDALAAAIVAYKQYESLLKRVDKTLAKEGKPELSEEVKSIVITRKISIKKAVALIEKESPFARAY